MTGINALLAIGLNLLLGFGGQVSLGHAAFYGLWALTAWAFWPVQRPLAVLVVPAVRAWPHGGCRILDRSADASSQRTYWPWPPWVSGSSSRSYWWRSRANRRAVRADGHPAAAIGSLIIKGDRAFAILVWLIVLVFQAGIGNLRPSRTGRAMLAIQVNEVAAASPGGGYRAGETGGLRGQRNDRPP